MAPLTSSQMELCNTGPVLLGLLIFQGKTEIQIFSLVGRRLWGHTESDTTEAT